MAIETQLVPLINTGIHTDGDKAMVSSWEKIENARLIGDRKYLRYGKRPGFDKKTDCPIEDAYAIVGYKGGGFAIGEDEASVYDPETDTWANTVNIRQEYSQKIKPLAAIITDFTATTVKKTSSTMLVVGDRIYHAYNTFGDTIYLDILDSAGGFLKNIFELTLETQDSRRAKGFINIISDGTFLFLTVANETATVSADRLVIYKFHVFDEDIPERASEWAESVDYLAGDFFEDATRLYRVDTDYTSSAKGTPFDFTPDTGNLTLIRERLSIGFDLTLAGKILRAVTTKVIEDKAHLGFLTTWDTTTDETEIWWFHDMAAIASCTNLTDVTTTTVDNSRIENVTITNVIDSSLDFLGDITDKTSIRIESRILTRSAAAPTAGSLDLYFMVEEYDGTGGFSDEEILSNNENFVDGASVFVSQFEPLVGQVVPLSMTMVSATDLGGTKLMVRNSSFTGLVEYEDRYLYNVQPISDPFYVADRDKYYAFFKTMLHLGKDEDTFLAAGLDPVNNRCYLFELVSGRSPELIDNILQGARRHPNDAVVGETFPNSFFSGLTPISSFAYGENVPNGDFQVHVDGSDVYFPYFSPQSKLELSNQFYLYIKIDFSDEGKINEQAIDAFGTLLLAGNILKEFDGANVVENNFFNAPEILTVETSGSGHVWKYKAIYTSIDANGNKSYSRPSATATYDDVNEVDLAITNCIVSAKKNIFIELYRTEDNGSTFRRVKVLRNELSAYAQEHTDSVTDAEMLSLEESFRFPYIYSDGSDILPNEHIAGVKNLAIHNSRVYLQSEQDNVTYYSKGKGAGESVAFSFLLSIGTTVSDLGSATAVGNRGITFSETGALAAFGGFLIIFEDKKIYAISGDGADPDGNNVSFSDIQIVSESQGCSDPQSVVTIPDGVLFKGSSSWYVIGSSLKPVDVGDEIDGYFDFDVKSSAVDVVKGYVYYFIPDSTPQTILVFDYQNGGHWYEYTTDLGSISDMTVLNENLSFIQEGVTDNFYQEGSNFTDDGSSYTMIFRPSWISLAKIQGFQRILRLMILGQVKDDNFTYELDEMSDYDNSAILTKTFDSGKSQVEFHVSRQKTEGFKFELRVIPSGGTEECIEIENFLVKAGVTENHFRVGSKG